MKLRAAAAWAGLMVFLSAATAAVLFGGPASFWLTFVCLAAFLAITNETPRLAKSAEGSLMKVERAPWMSDAGYASAVRAQSLNTAEVIAMQRERVEAWYRRKISAASTALRRDASGYVEEDADCRWSAWQAALADREVP